MGSSRPPSAAEQMRLLHGRWIVLGSLLGFAISFVVLGLTGIVGLFLHGTLGNVSETAVSLLVLVGYWLAGRVAVGPDAAFPATAGALAGAGGALLGFLTSLAIWAVHHNGAYLRGERAQHPEIALLGPFVIGAIIGALGGILTAHKRASAPMTVARETSA